MRRTKTRRRSLIQWFVAASMAVLGLGMLIGMVVTEITDYHLRTSGVHTTASVEDEHQDGRTTFYLLSFNDTKGNPLFEWSSDVTSGTKVGDRIKVVYDAADPSEIQDEGVLSRGPVGALILLPSGLFLLWIASIYFRAEPGVFLVMLKSRYGGHHTR